MSPCGDRDFREDARGSEPRHTRPVRTFALVVTAAIALTFAATASARIPPQYKNCTALNKKYEHGVGLANAHDKSSGIPVTTFTRSTHLYRLAMSYNAGL